MRRLFSTFAHGAPGAGLLLMRVGVSVGLGAHAWSVWFDEATLGLKTYHAGLVVLGILLLIGLWTPVVGGLLALAGLANAVMDHGYPWYWLMVVILAASLMLLGPGAWSVDAWMYGWRRVEIPDRKGDEDSL